MVVNNKNHPQKKIIKHAQFTPHDLSLFNFQAVVVNRPLFVPAQPGFTSEL